MGVFDANTTFSSSQDIVNQGVVQVCDRALYDLARERAPAANGPLDPLMGLSGKAGLCQTCGEPMQKCNGHFGYVKLALPALHIGYLKKIIMVLQDICKVRTVTKRRDVGTDLILGMRTSTSYGEGPPSFPSGPAETPYR